MHDQEYAVLRSILLRYWLSCGIPEDLAEELAQEGIVHAYTREHVYQGKNGASKKTFLTMVGKNRGRDFLRKEGKHTKRCVSLEALREESDFEPEA